jgi:hypothetical protein
MLADPGKISESVDHERCTTMERLGMFRINGKQLPEWSEFERKILLELTEIKIPHRNG